MKATETAAPTIPREKFSTFVSGLLGHYPDPEGDPQPPGPWDPVIRLTFEKVFGPFPEPWREVFSPHPEPWRLRFESADERLRNLARIMPEIWDVIGGGGRLESVALNPQPLPPRWAFGVEFIRLAADRMVLIQEAADAIRAGDDRGIIVVGGRVSELVDFVCGNHFPRRIPPRPGPDPDPRLTGQELVLMGGALVGYSKTVANGALAEEFTAAGERLIDAGLGRL
jgi:hypothetical protein